MMLRFIDQKATAHNLRDVTRHVITHPTIAAHGSKRSEAVSPHSRLFLL